MSKVREFKIYEPPFYKTLKFWLYAALTIAILSVLFVFKIIIIGNITERGDLTIINIFVTLNDPEGTWGFSFANGLLLGAYIGVLFASNHSPKWLGFLILVFVLIFAFFGIGLGIGLEIYSPVFNPQLFLSNTEDGINFFIGNLGILSLIFFASLIAETEVKE